MLEYMSRNQDQLMHEQSAQESDSSGRIDRELFMSLIAITHTTYHRYKCRRHFIRHSIRGWSDKDEAKG